MVELEPMGDQGVLARLGDEAAAVAWAAAVRRHPPLWLVDVVQAYTTVAVFHDLDRASLTEALAWLGGLRADAEQTDPGPLRVIPCCYEMGPDLEAVAVRVGLSPDEIVRLHTSLELTVHAIGFCPGFPYMGYLPAALCGVPRRESPRLRVEPGSVGITARQTGIYTEPRPGGWALIGRTPLLLVDVVAGYFPLRTGDRVRFERIGPREYEQLEGQRLE